MTGTIKPFADVSYKDPKTRYMEYQKNIKRYIKESNFDIIIFAENSLTEEDAKKIIDLITKDL